jgi:hypothetical protein
MRIVFRCDPAIENELMRPVAARAALPEWLRAMPRTAFSELRGIQHGRPRAILR